MTSTLRMPDGFTLFSTPIGECGVAWTAHGIAAVQLPEGSPEATAARLRRRHPAGASAAPDASPPPAVREAIDAIVALLGGEPRDLGNIAVDLRAVPPFHRRVYELARTIAPGFTLSYGVVAARLGVPGAARAVGHALGRNPVPIIVPCHRVLAARGRAGGFSAGGGVDTKLRLLAIERAEFAGSLPLFDAIATPRRPAGG